MSEQDQLYLAASMAENGMPIAAGRPEFLPHRLVVRLSDRERSDPIATLAAIRNALSHHGVFLEWQIVPEGSDSGKVIDGAA
jgi:hypothetical protein